MEDSRARVAEQREAALIEKLKILESELAARKPEGEYCAFLSFFKMSLTRLLGAHAVVPVIVHNKLMEAAEQRRQDAERKYAFGTNLCFAV